MKIHNCGHKFCRTKIPISQKYCDEHKSDGWKTDSTKPRQRVRDRQYNESRDKEATAFYKTSQWTKMREYVYARDMGICQICGEMITDRKIVDHLHPYKFAKDQKLDSDNLWVLCYRCHNHKTRLEQRIAKSQNGKNILTHMTKTWVKEKIRNEILRN